jgi:RND family efflux transporter MFP subunit
LKKKNIYDGKIMTCNSYRQSVIRQTQARHRGSVLVIIILMVGIAVASSAYIMRPKPKTRPLPPIEIPQVSVLKAEPKRYRVTVNTQGTVVPSREIDLVSEVSGRVIEVNSQFAKGAFFNAGDVLIKLDNRDYAYRVTQANAQVANAERELALERGQARQARKEWRDLGSAEANALFLREPQIRAAQAQLASARAELQQARLNMQRTEVQSFFDGRIQQTHVNLGQFITAGAVVASIYDSHLAEVRLPLTDQQVGKIGLPLGTTLTPEQQVDVTLSANVAGTTYEWPAVLVRTEATIDRRTRFYFGVVEIPEPFDSKRYQAPLLMGLFVEAKVAGKFFDDVIRLPLKAIFKQQSIYIVSADNTLQQRQIEIIDKRAGQVWVRADVKSGDAVVISDPNVLRPGMPVAIGEVNSPK